VWRVAAGFNLGGDVVGLRVATGLFWWSSIWSMKAMSLKLVSELELAGAGSIAVGATSW